jgi:hypothetical protein
LQKVALPLQAASSRKRRLRIKEDLEAFDDEDTYWWLMLL